MLPIKIGIIIYCKYLISDYSPTPILDALTLDMRLEKPFKIQAKTLPYIMNNRNIIAQAQAGRVNIPLVYSLK